MTAEAQFIANRLNAQKTTSTQSQSISLGTPADCFMQNKPNFRKARMNVNKVLTKDYENKSNWKLGENKANTKPIKANTNPISETSKWL